MATAWGDAVSFVVSGYSPIVAARICAEDYRRLTTTDLEVVVLDASAPLDVVVKEAAAAICAFSEKRR